MRNPVAPEPPARRRSAIVEHTDWRAEELPHRMADVLHRVPPAHEILERLARLAEDIRFSQYVVCAFCYTPIALFGVEAETFATMDCPQCGGVLHRALIEVHSYQQADRR